MGRAPSGWRESGSRVEWVAPSGSRAEWVARPARGSPASCRGAMASKKRRLLLSRCGAFVSLFSRDDLRISHRNRAARDAALHRTGRPTHYRWVARKWVARPARGSPASCRGAMASKKRASLLSRRSAFSSRLSGRSSHLAPNRAARDAALHRTGRPTHWASDGTSNPLRVGRASRARLPGILPGSDGVKETQIAPLAMWCVRVSRLSGRSSHLVPNRAARDAALHRTGRPTHCKWVARLARGSPASCRGAMASKKRRLLLSRCGAFVSLDSRDDPRISYRTGRRGTPPCIGRDVQPTASGSRVPREAPRHPAGERWRQRNAHRSSRDVVRSALDSRDDPRISHRTGRRGTPPCIGRDVQPTGHRTGRPTHYSGSRAEWVARPARGSPASCRGAMASKKRRLLLSRCGAFGLSTLGTTVVPCP